MSAYAGFLPSEAELQLAEYLLATEGANWPRNLSFNSALRIFDLQETHLRSIWLLADKDGKGHLSKNELTIAIRLIGWAQAGHAPMEHLLRKQCPLPILRQITNSASNPSTNATMLMKAVKASQVNNDGPFIDVFNQEGPVNGVLDRNQILGIFVSQSSLPFHLLVQVFEIIDVDGREALNSMEFCLAMHILEAFDVGSLWSIMPMIPAGMRAQLSSLQSSNTDDYSTMAPSELQDDLHSGCLSASMSSQGRQRRLNEAIPLPFSSEAYNTPLPDEQETALDFVRSELKRNGYLTVDILSMFLRYNIRSVEIAHMWQMTSSNANAIELFIRLIRKRLGSANSGKILPLRPLSREKSISTDTTLTERWPIPTESDHPPRIPSPASSEYSSTSSTDYVDAFNISPYEGQGADVVDVSSSCLNKPPRPFPDEKFPPTVPLAVVHHESDLKPQSDESGKITGTDSRCIRDEIQSLRLQLEEVKNRLSEPLSATKQHRLQDYYTGEIDRLTSTLAQRDNRCQVLEDLLKDSQAQTDKHLDHASELVDIVDEQRNIIDTQNESLRILKIQLDETKNTMAELTSTSTTPAMRILFLRASLRASETEINRAKAEAEELQLAVNTRDAQISELHSRLSACGGRRAHQVDLDSDVEQDLKPRHMETLQADMGYLKTQIHDMRRIMEHSIGLSESEAATRKTRWDDIMYTQVREQPTAIPELNGVSQILVKGTLKNNHQRNSETHITVNNVEVPQYMPQDVGPSRKLRKDLLVDMGLTDPPQDVSNQGLIQISESLSHPPSTPKESTNAKQTLTSITTRAVDNLTSSGTSESTPMLESPPGYPENSNYAAFNFFFFFFFDVNLGLLR